MDCFVYMKIVNTYYCSFNLPLTYNIEANVSKNAVPITKLTLGDAPIAPTINDPATTPNEKNA